MSADEQVLTHGPARLSAVQVDSYNVEIKDDGEFVGDRAEAAFAALERWREPLRKLTWTRWRAERTAPEA
jgi:hypothetical protein